MSVTKQVVLNWLTPIQIQDNKHNYNTVKSEIQKAMESIPNDHNPVHIIIFDKIVLFIYK